MSDISNPVKASLSKLLPVTEVTFRYGDQVIDGVHASDLFHEIGDRFLAISGRRFDKSGKSMRVRASTIAHERDGSGEVSSIYMIGFNPR